MQLAALTDSRAVVPFARTTQHKTSSGRFSDSYPTLRPLPIQNWTVGRYHRDSCLTHIGHSQRRDRHGFSPCSHLIIQPKIPAEPKMLLSIIKEPEKIIPMYRFLHKKNLRKKLKTAKSQQSRQIPKAADTAVGRSRLDT